jgi:hypothetical protein
MAVYHLSETPTGTVYDSTSNNIDLTPNAMESGDQVGGPIDGSINFDGDPERLASSNTITIESFTIEAWVSSDSWTGWHTFVSVADAAGENWRDFGSSDDDPFIDPDGTSYDIAQLQSGTAWRHIVGRYDDSAGSNRLRGFINGTITGDTANPSLSSLTGYVALGSLNYYGSWSDYYNGRLDEVRISNISRSSDWIAAEYNNQNDTSTFYTVGAEQINPGNWQFRKLVTINSSLITGDLTNFPVLVSTTDSDLSSKARSDGYDIVFTSLDGRTKLDYEVESYTTGTGALVSWVEIPSLSSTTDTYIYMYYGNSGQTISLANPTGVWDSNYVMVQHLNESDIDGGSGDIKDSTGKNNGTTSGMDTNDQVSGKIDGAFDFDRTNDYIDVGNLQSLAGESELTLSVWFYARTLPSVSGENDGILMQHDDWDEQFGFRFDGANSRLNGYVETGAVSAGANIDYSGNVYVNTWHHILLTFNNGVVKVYLDTVLKDTDDQSASFTTIPDITNNMGIGSVELGSGDFFDGKIDEVRISNISRSTDWINASFNNHNYTNLFCQIGSEEGGEAAVSYTNSGAAYIFFGYGGISSDDINAASANVTIYGSNDNDNLGWDVSDIGDVNGDNKDDIIIGAPGYSSDKGRAYIFYGRSDWSGIDSADGEADVKITGEASGNNFSMSVSGAGDVNNLNYNDVIIGAPNYGTSSSNNWWNSNWGYRKKLTFNNTDQDEAMVNFPVLINLSSSNFNYSKALANGSDLRFIDADGSTVLKHHNESWDTSGYSNIWVNATNIAASSSTDYIWMYYGNSDAGNVEDESGTYSHYYQGVWHLAEDPGPGGSDDIKDSTSNANHGTADSSMTSADLVDVQVGKGIDFDGDSTEDDYIGLKSTIAQTVGSYEFWIYPTEIGSGGNKENNILCSDAYTSRIYTDTQYFEIETDTDAEYFQFTTQGLTANTLYYAVFARNGDAVDLYIDGSWVEQDTTSSANTLTIGSTDSTAGIGGDDNADRIWPGDIDEVRITNNVLTADWIAAQYLSMTNTFITFGDEEEPIAAGSGKGRAYIFHGDGSIPTSASFFRVQCR